jgi:hypothetical protein
MQDSGLFCHSEAPHRRLETGLRCSVMESAQRQTDLTNPGAIAFLSNDHPGLMGKLSASVMVCCEGTFYFRAYY